MREYCDSMSGFSANDGKNSMRAAHVTAQDRARLRRARERGRARDASAVVGAHYDPHCDVIELRFRAGGEMTIPRRMVPGLEAAHPSALRAIELSPAGDALSWPSLEVDVYVPGLGGRAFGARLFGVSTDRCDGGRSGAKTTGGKSNRTKETQLG